MAKQTDDSAGKIKFKVIKNVPEEIVTVPANATLSDYERALGQVMMKVGKQQQIVNEQTKILQVLQNAANTVSTAIENLDG